MQRIFEKSGNAVIVKYSMGYVAYTNEMVRIENYLLKGTTPGSSLSVCFEHKIANHIYLSMKGNFFGASLTGFTVDDGAETFYYELESGSYEGLGKAEFAIGLHVVL